MILPLLKVLLPLIINMMVIVCIGLILRKICIRASRSREERGDHDSPLSPTLQWMNTAGSILLAANKGNFRYMAGDGRPGNEAQLKPALQKVLWDYWEIQGHESAMQEMTSLLHKGMRASYRTNMERLESIYSGYSEEALIQVAKQENPNADEDSFLPKMLMAYRRYGENALLGWDMGRAAFIIQWCYLCGYVSMEEVLEIGVEAGKKAQAVFQNWEEMMESYLLGGQYWQREDRGDPNSMTAKRWKLYETMWKGKKPYTKIPYTTIAFDTPLSKQVITDEYGRMIKK